MKKSHPTILLIRHGETQWNVEGRLQGWQDAPLTLNGFRQICAVGENLRKIHGDLRNEGDIAYHTSTLGRARQTASILADMWAGRFDKFDADSALVERSYGAWEGLSLAEVAKHRAEEFALHQNDPWNYQVPGGEFKSQVLLRIKTWLNDLSINKTHVVVTHSGCFRLIRGLYAGASREEMDCYREPQTTSYLLRSGKSIELTMPEILTEQFKLNGNALTVHI
ncbi:MAG: histidine phosphatase family protein [Porticoccaceae bacterium]